MMKDFIQLSRRGWAAARFGSRRNAFFFIVATAARVSDCFSGGSNGKTVRPISVASSSKRRSYWNCPELWMPEKKHNSAVGDRTDKLTLFLSNNDSNRVNGGHGGPNGSSRDDQQRQQQEERVPRTGWNHNQPKESSDFWKSKAEVESSKQRERSTAPTPDNSVSEPRTGWLHRTEPAKPTKTAKGDKSKPSEARRRLQLAMKQQEHNHRIVSPPAFHSCGDNRLIAVTEHFLSVPVHRNTAGAAAAASSSSTGRIDVYFSIVEVVKNEERKRWFESLGSLSPRNRAAEYIQDAGLKTADDMMLFLQGGPGFGAPTPVVGIGFTKESSWAAKALDRYSRIVLMDQRGTGRSTPITKQSLEKRFPKLFSLDDVAAGDDSQSERSLDDLGVSHPQLAADVKEALVDATDFLAQFRADNIVRDAESILDALLLPAENEDSPRPWGCALGQSFGGFCMMTYLSLVPHPPRVCLLTGGIAPMLTPVYQVYNSLFDRVMERNLRYYEMYPGDVPLVRLIVRKLLAKPETLPGGGTLTARRFLQLGLCLGGSPSSFAGLHALISTAFLNNDVDVNACDDCESLEFTRSFLKTMDSEMPFDDYPIYFWLHESIYANGGSPHDNIPTDWAAHRAYENKRKENTIFDYEYTSSSSSSSEQPTLFFGEMVFPWMAKDYKELGGFGLSALSDALASKQDWGKLFDGDRMRKVLSDGTSRAAAAVYHEDFYVDFESSMKVVARGKPLEKCKVWVTNEYQHSGLRDDGAKIFEKLFGMAQGTIRTPS